MEILYDQLDNLRPSLAVAATIGVFDGVHVGHQEVFRRVREVAERIGVESAVVTFDSHPAHVVRPLSAPQLLTDLDQKLELIAEQGIDYAYVIHFDEERADTPAEQFVEQVFRDALHAKAVVVGEDFHFGKGRLGNVSELSSLGELFGFEVYPLELIRHSNDADEPVSSTVIRRALAAGEVSRAAAMLGRPHEVRGTVQHGSERGRSIGFPTANVPVPDLMARPANGVYSGWFTRRDKSVHACAINIGYRPTFDDVTDRPVLEAHLIDFDGDLYDEEVAVSFVSYLRSERRFEGVDQLVAQLRVDVDDAARALDAA